MHFYRVKLKKKLMRQSHGEKMASPSLKIISKIQKSLWLRFTPTPLTPSFPSVSCLRYTLLPEGSLRVHSVQLSDAGRYYCTVSNQAGSDHRGVDLRVFGDYHTCSSAQLKFWDLIQKSAWLGMPNSVFGPWSFHMYLSEKQLLST